MLNDGKLSPDQITTIIEHNGRLIAGTERVIQKLLVIPFRDRGKDVTGQIRYHRNVLAALKWSNNVAKQRIQYGAKLNAE